MKENHDSDGDFILEKQQQVLCIPQKVKTSDEEVEGEVAAKPTPTNAAALFPGGFWLQPKCIHLIWATRWTTTGLMPVRPQLMPAQDLLLQAGHALKIL